MQGEQKQRHVRSVFEKIAPKYDVMNDLLSFNRHKAWRAFTMKQMNVQAGQTAIDVCCGTCDWTIAIAKASGTGSIIGLDFSPNMLSHGQVKIDSRSLQDQITLVEGNALELPYPDNSFDFATIGFGLRNVPDYERAVSEMMRVVKPGGKVVCLELSKPMKQPFKGLYYFYFERVLPWLGKVFASSFEQYRWLPESLQSFLNQEELADLFRKVGLVDIRIHPLTFGIAALHLGVKPKLIEEVER